MSLHLIVVGKLKDKAIESLEAEYLKRLRPTLTIHELKATGDNLEKEEKEIKNKLQSLKQNGSLKSVLLTEQGKQYDSERFAHTIQKFSEESSNVVFIIGGALGFSNEFKEEVKEQLSLSKLTYPHRLARLLFVEQLYRAQTIINGHPYNH